MNDNDYGRIERDVMELRQTVYGNGGVFSASVAASKKLKSRFNIDINS